MKKEITLEEAQEVIKEFPDQDEYVQAHYQQYLVQGEHSDNTCETHYYWRQCKDIVDKNTSSSK